MRKIPVAGLPGLYAALAANRQLWIPLENGGIVDFALWKQGAPVSLAGKTAKSGKDFFFPQTEDIVSFRTSGKEIIIAEAERATAPFVVFGMRACDAAGMGVLDNVFLADPKDSFYEARRNAGIIVTLACGQSLPGESCFCSAFGIDPSGADAGNPGAGDVAAWIAGDTLYWKPVTDKGEKLTADLASILEDAGADGEKAVAAEQSRIAALMQEMPFASLALPEVSPEELDRYFELPAWAKLSESCLGCGTCTFVCPACQCYDIEDRPAKDGSVRRFRCWDSCMYSDFTLMAHGNPRTTQLQRFRQRFMHKLVYYPQNNGGLYSCVGCGRCVEKCPSGLNIVQAIKMMTNTGGERT